MEKKWKLQKKCKKSKNVKDFKKMINGKVLLKIIIYLKKWKLQKVEIQMKKCKKNEKC